MQRLFSGFAGGWPGTGLLLLRLLTGAALIHFGIASLRDGSPPTTVVLETTGAGAGVLLVIGLWTPAAGTLAAIVKVAIAFSQYLSDVGDPWILLVQALLGVILAMVGPGAWSIDARLFGRKRIDLPEL